MTLHIEPCLKAAKYPGHQLFCKCKEEAHEVEEAYTEYSMALRQNVDYDRREKLRRHVTEEIVDVITAYCTLAAEMELDIEGMCEEVIRKNRERVYITSEGIYD